MSEPTLQISCSIGTTEPLSTLGIEVILDGQIILDLDHVTETVEFNHTLSDADGNHSLEFVMKNKTTEHTKIDSQGNIIADACLTISNLEFDNIELKQIFIDHAVYTHDFNGTQPETQEKFYGDMGCNGTVKLDFTTPMYMWLLENM
jgi:hypothetical protein